MFPAAYCSSFTTCATYSKALIGNAGTTLCSGGSCTDTQCCSGEYSIFAIFLSGMFYGHHFFQVLCVLSRFEQVGFFFGIVVLCQNANVLCLPFVSQNPTFLRLDVQQASQARTSKLHRIFREKHTSILPTSWCAFCILVCYPWCVCFTQLGQGRCCSRIGSIKPKFDFLFVFSMHPIHGKSIEL